MQDEQGGMEPGQKGDHQSKIKWAINIFKPFKSAGTDDIIPALLQNEVEYLDSYLCSTFRLCLTYGFIPRSLSQATMTFIPEPRKPNL
jgi:hypothetical protein